jgi:hypothetical protein
LKEKAEELKVQASSQAEILLEKAEILKTQASEHAAKIQEQAELLKQQYAVMLCVKLPQVLCIIVIIVTIIQLDITSFLIQCVTRRKKLSSRTASTRCWVAPQHQEILSGNERWPHSTSRKDFLVCVAGVLLVCCLIQRGENKCVLHVASCVFVQFSLSLYSLYK